MTLNDATIHDLIEKFLAMREKIALLESEHKQRMAPYEQAMTKLERAILHKLDEAGAQNMKTAAGTAYVRTVTKASVADWPSLQKYVEDTGDWSMLNHSVNKTAAAAYIEAHDTPPPGVAWGTHTTIGVRRA